MNDHQIQNLLHDAVSTTTKHRIQPSLTDRIMLQVTSIHEPHEHFFQVLWDAFKPIAFAATLLILGLMSYSMVLSQNYEASPTTIELVFGLKPLTLTSAYLEDLDAFHATIP